ncbi:zinc finger protein 37 isoform X2 [Oreochromis aureus]|uniref:zinc finger protein 37 isoform X2 n=1 Tax=Oreochromis aureus TaxID=47969 RepID=UPI0019533740|nr:zinc finger protein 37 isoform X2 [Oreochromis aureus]
MEGSASSTSVEDGAENKHHEGTLEENAGPSTEETADNKELSVECKDCGLKFAQQELYETHLHQHAVEDEETPMEEDRTAETVSERADDGERNEDVKNTLRQNYKYRVSFQKHQRLHRKRSSKGDKTNANMQEQPRKEDHVERSDGEGPGEDARTAEHDSSVESDCTEPVCHSKVSKLSDGSESEDVRSQTRGEVDENKELSVECKDCGLKFAQQELYETHLHQHAVEDEEAPMEEDRTAETVSERADDGESRNENVKNTLRRGYTCVTCGKNYKYRVSFQKHQRLHRKRSSKGDKTNANMQEQPRKEDNVERSDGEGPGEDARTAEHDSSVESDCTEPVCHSKVSKLSDGSESEDVRSQTRGEVDENEEHRVECKDCGLKFTQWENYETHLHQHALEEEEGEIEDRMVAEPVPEREDAGENGDESMIGNRAECDESNSAQTGTSDPIQSFGVSTASVKNAPRKDYVCSICGKIYAYLVSFKKHQQLHENESSASVKPPNESILRQYECPDCGMLFIRRTRLISHLRVHRACISLKSAPHRCDTCNKDFASVWLWLAHAELHKQNPFWCLSCAHGFRDEASLDKHLQNHYRRHGSIRTSAQPTGHFSNHGGAKQSFSNPGKVISHQKQHRTNSVNLGGLIKRSALLPCVEEEPEMNADLKEPPDEEESTQKTGLQSPCEKIEDRDRSDESDCGEPVFHFKILKQASLADLSDESKSGDVQSQRRNEPDDTKSQEINVHSDHKYWEWECFDCDMGFDDVAKLHSHYIKHATGELPILWDNTEG